MKERKITRYWLLSLFGVLIASYYPLYMGISVIGDMIRDGTVMKENYPKYIIPYTPIAFAVILGVLLLPLIVKFIKWLPTVVASAPSLGTFFGVELLFEDKVVVTSTETVTETVSRLADWQMYMCRYIPPEEYAGVDIITSTSVRTETPVDLLMGNYNPAFKMHFYMISIVLIIAILNSVYGFAHMIKTGDKSRKKALILQSFCAVAFLGMCILACFTAFWRDGNINVSPLSATLMSVFFILLGVTAGIFLGSLLLKSSRGVALWIPTILATITTLLMYIGEMILLHAHLYRFGTGFFFDGLPGIVLAPVDIVVILATGLVTYILMRFIGVREPEEKEA